MNKERKCPKCGSRDILVEEGSLSDTGSIRVRGSLFARMPIIHTICTDCGYVEMWVSQEDLRYLKKEKQKRDSRSPFWK